MQLTQQQIEGIDKAIFEMHKEGVIPQLWRLFFSPKS